MRPNPLQPLLILLSLTCNADAIVLSDYAADKTPSPREGVMRRVVMLRYTRLGVCGGSGVVIGPRHVLTAKHGTATWSARQLRVDLDGANKRWLTVEQITNHPEANIDLAVLRLAKPLDFQPIEPLDRAACVGERVWIGGFGVYGAPGEPKGFGRFHAGFNRVTHVKNGLAKIVLDREGEASEALPAAVDSGSPVWVETPRGWSLAGISIRATNSRGPSFGDYSQHQSLASVREWLRTTTGEVASAKNPPSDAALGSR